MRLGDSEGCQFGIRTYRRRGSQQIKLQCKLPWCSDSTDSKVLQISVEDRDAVYILCQVLIGELQHRPLGFLKQEHAFYNTV